MADNEHYPTLDEIKAAISPEKLAYVELADALTGYRLLEQVGILDEALTDFYAAHQKHDVEPELSDELLELLGRAVTAKSVKTNDRHTPEALFLAQAIIDFGFCWKHDPLYPKPSTTMM